MKFLKRVLFSAILLELLYIFIPINYIDKDLKPYYNTYMLFVNSSCNKSQYFYPKKVYIRVSKIKQEDPNSNLVTIGLCEYSPPTAFRITIDEKFFKSATNLERFQTLAHEMRHCLFGAGHSDDPHNYMYAELPILEQGELYNQIMIDINKSCPIKE